MLQFSTGCARVPIGGFKDLSSYDGKSAKFCLSRADKAKFIFPLAHTCFNRIDLPNYGSKEEMRKYLTLVISMEITEFGLE